jgi:hypothetical protein
MNISYSEKRKYFLLAAVKQDVTSLEKYIYDAGTTECHSTMSCSTQFSSLNILLIQFTQTQALQWKEKRNTVDKANGILRINLSGGKEKARFIGVEMLQCKRVSNLQKESWKAGYILCTESYVENCKLPCNLR